jgi:hypothetical protein
MARAGAKTREIMRAAMQCKVDGLCERDKLVNAYLAVRIASCADRRQAILEGLRGALELPRCPPVCPEPDIEVVTITKTEIL